MADDKYTTNIARQNTPPRDPMKRHLPLILLCCSSTLAQQPPQTPSSHPTPPQTKPAPIAQSITVTTTLEPLPLAESDRSVNLLSPRDSDDQPLLSNSV